MRRMRLGVAGFSVAGGAGLIPHQAVSVQAQAGATPNPPGSPPAAARLDSVPIAGVMG